MRREVLLDVLVLAMMGVVVGCFSSGIAGDALDGSGDGSPEGDGGVPLRECEIAPDVFVCGRFCPSDRNCDSRGVGRGCSGSPGLCGRPIPPAGSAGCFLEPGRERAGTFCSDDELCVVRSGSLRSGDCVPVNACAAVEELNEGNFACIYWDGTRFESGPTFTDRCPADEGDRPGFCGPGCATGCRGAPFLLPGGGGLPAVLNWCAGVNEDRDVGICTYGGDCEPGSTGIRVIGGTDEIAPLACLVERTEDGELRDHGVFVFRADCRRYRAIYPEFSCLDAPSWTELP